MQKNVRKEEKMLICLPTSMCAGVCVGVYNYLP